MVLQLESLAHVDAGNDIIGMYALLKRADQKARKSLL